MCLKLNSSFAKFFLYDVDPLKRAFKKGNKKGQQNFEERRTGPGSFCQRRQKPVKRRATCSVWEEIDHPGRASNSRPPAGFSYDPNGGEWEEEVRKEWPGIWGGVGGDSPMGPAVQES